jgi:hypothetical protein
LARGITGPWPLVRSLRRQACFHATLSAARWTSPASADACDDFNLMRFDPKRLEECIKHMKFTYELQLNSLELENHSLQVEICLLASELKDLRPSAYDMVKEFCVPAKLKKDHPALRNPAQRR